MNKKRLFIIVFIFFLQIIFTRHSLFAKDLHQYPAAIHIQSNFSDGIFSIPQIIDKAREKNIKILVFTDTILRRWEYGVWPFQNLFKRRVEENSIMKNGLESYLKTIKQAKKDNPDMVIIAGLEAVPLYYWTGNFLKGDLALRDWHKQILVIGFDNASSYRRLPIAGNRTFIPKDWKDLAMLFWPVILIFISIRLFIKSREIFEVSLISRRNFAILGICLGLFFLLNNISFSVSGYDQYASAEVGIAPHQNLIDYANENNGLTFWAHPEATYVRKYKNIDVITKPYKYDLARSKDYTGFPAIYQDNETMTEPGDLWDEILLSYCEGSGRKPIWGIGDIDYDGTDQEELDTIQTIFLLDDLNEKNALDALRDGRIYAKVNRKKNDFVLTDFSITDFLQKKKAVMGETITLDSRPVITIKSRCSLPQEDMTIRLIRNGEIVKTFFAEDPQFVIEFQDAYLEKNSTAFYRLEIDSDFCKILSNPIFVRFSKN